MKRRTALIALAGLSLSLFPTSSCALFSGFKKDAAEEEISQFSDDRTEGEKMSDFAASAGRSDPTKKKKASAGDTFLFSSKAKEIFDNTER